MTNDLLALRRAPPRLSDVQGDERVRVLRQRHDANKAAWLRQHETVPGMGARIARAVLATIGKGTR